MTHAVRRFDLRIIIFLATLHSLLFLLSVSVFQSSSESPMKTLFDSIPSWIAHDAVASLTSLLTPSFALLFPQRQSLSAAVAIYSIAKVKRERCPLSLQNRFGLYPIRPLLRGIFLTFGRLPFVSHSQYNLIGLWRYSRWWETTRAFWRGH